MKEDAITWGDLEPYALRIEKSAEVIVIRGNELLTEIAEVSQTDEGLNVNLPEIELGEPRSLSDLKKGQQKKYKLGYDIIYWSG